MAEEKTRPVTLKRLLMLPLQILVALFVVIDEVSRPIFRPLIRWFRSLRIVEKSERFVAALPPYAILAVLAVPLAVAEPLKLLSLILIGSGRPVRGILLLVFAHLLSFLLIERIYEAGKPKLMTIGWLGRVIVFVDGIRGRLLAWVKATPVWALLVATRLRAARFIAALRAR